MKKTNSQIKGTARECLMGKYAITICGFLLVELLTILCSSPFDKMFQKGTAFCNTTHIIIGVAGSLIVSLLSIALSMGLCHMHLELARKRTPKILSVFQPLKTNANRTLGISGIFLLLAIICELPGILVLYLSGDSLLEFGTMASPGLFLAGIALYAVGMVILIILFLTWSQSFYLLLDHPDMTVMESLRESRLLMKGFKAKLFGLSVSFIGYVLLSVLTLCIGLLWVAPYISQAMAQFYLELTKEEPVIQ